MSEEEIMNRFFENIQKNIINIPENLKQNYINYEVSKLFKLVNSNYVNTFLNYFFEIKKIAGDYSLEKKEKIKYCNNDCDIILIAQYYKTDDAQRQKENDVCLINNIINDSISKIHLLNEQEYDLEYILSKLKPEHRKKVKQHVIEKRMTFHDGMAYANTFCKNKIIIIANLDIFFTSDLVKCKSYDFTNLFCSLSRYELLHDYNFNGDNKLAKFIHNGQMGNPCIDSHDAWMFKAPIKMTPKAKIMLGSEGCDTIINYIYGEIMKYNVVNPINSIITIHYHRERERDYRTKNRVRSHSGLEYNKDNTFDPDTFQHKYILQKEIIVCNTIDSFCTVATKGVYKDLRLLLHSLEIYHPDIPVFIICDKWVNNKIDKDNYNLKIHKRIDLEKYTDMNRKKMEELDIFVEFLLYKAVVMEYALEKYNTTLYIDSDIVLLNKMDLLIDKTCDVGLSPHHILEESEQKFGKYNAGFMYIANKEVLEYWRNIVNERKTFDDQQALDYFEEKFKVFKFDDSYNYGWWRLFQCESPQKRLDLFMIDNNNIYYEFNTLKCIHTHLYEKNDYQTTQFNKLIFDILGKINHPMLRYINESEEEIYKEKVSKSEELTKSEKSTNQKLSRKIASFTQTYGEKRWAEILLQKYDKIGQYMRNKCDKIIYSFHNCSEETREKGKKYISQIYNNDKLVFFEYNNMDYLSSIRKTMSYLKENGFTDILFMNDDEYFLNNKSNLQNIKNLDKVWEYYFKNNIKWFSLYGKEIPLNKTTKVCDTINDNLNIYCYSTLEYKKDDAYAWSQTTALYNVDFCIDLYNNKLPDDSWNIEETFSYYFHTNDFDRWGCSMELVRAINFHGHNISELNLHDNLHRFFSGNENFENIYTIIKSIEVNDKINIEKLEDKEATEDNKNKEDHKPVIILPIQPRDDFWNHNNDTFRELVYMWKEEGLCNIKEENVKHVWLNAVGDTLLYDRPTIDWFIRDNSIKYKNILFGNPVIPQEETKGSNWIFWGRSPRKLELYHNMTYLDYSQRTLNSIFIGKIENNVQLYFRNEDYKKYIELYVMHDANEEYKYTQDEYLNLLRQSKFGLCLRGFGPKCNREIELMALGTVPIVEKNVDMNNYYDAPIEGIHYFKFNSPEEIKLFIDNCTEEQWIKMSQACITWYKKNSSCKGSFDTTLKIIKQLNKKNNDIIAKETTIKETHVENKFDELNCIDNIENKIVFYIGKEEEFNRENLKSFCNIDEIYKSHKKNHGDCLWNNINTFTRVQNIYIAKFENIKINSDGVMYDTNNVYTMNNNYYKKTMIEKKQNIYEFENNTVVFNCVQKWAYGYYHWLCEIYPRLFYIKLYIEKNSDYFKDKQIVLLLYYNNEFIHQYLEILKLDGMAICPYDYNTEYKAKEVYISTPPFCGNPSRDSINVVRQVMFKNNVLIPKVNIVLKRNFNRIIGNFDNMMEFLRNKYNNYQWVVFDDTDETYKNMINTIQLFSAAKLIIGAHGAGLSNMMFSSNKVKVIELHPENLGNVCYWHLSNILQNTHIMLPVKYINDTTFNVNLEQLDLTIDKLMNDVFCVDNI